MKNKKVLFVAVTVTILISVAVIIFCVKSQNYMNGPGNIPYISAEIIHMNDSSNYEVVVVEGNNDFKVGDKIWIENNEPSYERINDELTEINDLSEGDTIIIMYFEYNGNIINRVRSVERISEF